MRESKIFPRPLVTEQYTLNIKPDVSALQSAGIISCLLLVYCLVLVGSDAVRYHILPNKE